jgi:hypothetical protein
VSKYKTKIEQLAQSLITTKERRQARELKRLEMRLAKDLQESTRSTDPKLRVSQARLAGPMAAYIRYCDIVSKFIEEYKANE